MRQAGTVLSSKDHPLIAAVDALLGPTSSTSAPLVSHWGVYLMSFCK